MTRGTFYLDERDLRRLIWARRRVLGQGNKISFLIQFSVHTFVHDTIRLPGVHF